MYRDISLQKQAGMGLPTALFIILVLSLIVAALNNMNDISAKAYGREWLSMQAFYAAESGAQAAASWTLHPDLTRPSCNALYYTRNFSAVGMANCSVQVACVQDNVGSDNFYTLTSSGTCGTGIDQARRIIQVRLQP
jgi:MSHA biogenesis protein MshP